jgi:hypothetical protein
VHTAIPQEPYLVALTRISRVRGQVGDRYEVIFVDQHGRIIVPLTEWYRLRKELGPLSTRETYLTCLQPFLTFLIEQECPWNAPPERLRPVLVAFHRDRLGCLIQPGKNRECVKVSPTRDTPVSSSTLRVMRAALRDFYLVLKEAGLYPFSNPLSSEMLVALKRAHIQALANRGAPDHAGIREETREQSKRQPTAFLRYSDAQEWKPDLRKELADVRKGIHYVLDALIDNDNVSLREKAVLELLRNTGARLHEIVLLTVGGYRNEGIAGQAKVMDKGSNGREIKTIYFAHNPRVEQALMAYIEQVRPLHDPYGRVRLVDVADHEPLFLTEQKTPYSLKSFYWHWYKHYTPLQSLCPVHFSVHDIRHLFVTEFLITLRITCGAGTDQFNSDRYLREREAFGSQVMGWQSLRTIDIYDQSRDGERTLHVLATYQQSLTHRRYVVERSIVPAVEDEPETLPAHTQEEIVSSKEPETLWLHDAETLAWVKKMQLQSGKHS